MKTWEDYKRKALEGVDWNSTLSEVIDLKDSPWTTMNHYRSEVWKVVKNPEDHNKTEDYNNPENKAFVEDIISRIEKWEITLEQVFSHISERLWKEKLDDLLKYPDLYDAIAKGLNSKEKFQKELKERSDNIKDTSNINWNIWDIVEKNWKKFVFLENWISLIEEEIYEWIFLAKDIKKWKKTLFIKNKDWFKVLKTWIWHFLKMKYLEEDNIYSIPGSYIYLDEKWNFYDFSKLENKISIWSFRRFWNILFNYSYNNILFFFFKDWKISEVKEFSWSPIYFKESWKEYILSRPSISDKNWTYSLIDLTEGKVIFEDASDVSISLKKEKEDDDPINDEYSLYSPIITYTLKWEKKRFFIFNNHKIDLSKGKK